MKKNRFVWAFFSSLIFAAPSAWADKENWYTMWGIGMARHTYQGYVADDVNYDKSLKGIDRTQLSLEMLGFYFPISDDTTLLGFVIQGDADSFSDVYGDTDQFNQYNYALSSMYFTGSEPGEGFFVRGDVGAARLVRTLTISGVSASGATPWGTGFYLGAGYGIPISNETRILINAGYTLKRINGMNLSTGTFEISGLW